MPFDQTAALAALLAEADRRRMTRYELAKRSGIGQPQLGRLGPKTTIATLAALLSGLALPWRWLDTAAPLTGYAAPPRTCPRCGSPVARPNATYCDRPECRPVKASGRAAAREKQARALAMHAAGKPVKEICAAVGFAPGYVYALIRKHKDATK